MRHVSRTHRVALDWLFDRINLDPKIQIKYVDTKHQLADMVTKGNFKRDEWNNLLFLFDISHFSSICCAQNFSLTSCFRTMTKRMQERGRRQQDRGKVQADDDELGRLCLDKFLIRELKGSSKAEVQQWDMFPELQSCSWLVIRSNQFGPQDPNQIHGHQEPTRRHVDEGQFHTWWMESSFVFV